MDGQTIEELRAGYLQGAITALSSYLAAAGDVRLESSRTSDELTITFTLTDAEHYQELLAHLTESDAAGPPANAAGRQDRSRSIAPESTATT